MSVQTTPLKIKFQHTSMYLVDVCIRLIPLCPLLSGKPLMFFTINTIISWSAVNPGELCGPKKRRITRVHSVKGSQKIVTFQTWDPQLWSNCGHLKRS